jgi:Amt family ammonium transporter
MTCSACGLCTACAAPGAALPQASSAPRHLGGLGGVAFMSQLAGTALGVTVALVGGFVVYGTLKSMVGLRLDAEDEFNGADLSIHKISASAERETNW